MNRKWSLVVRRLAATLVMAFIISAPSHFPLYAQVAKTGQGPMIRVKTASTLASSYNGPQDAVQALLTGQVQPLSLVSCDCDEDGITDLVLGYAAAGGGGILTWHRGNIEAFAPQTPETFKAMSIGNFQDPVLPGASSFRTTVRPDFLAVGNFYDSGHTSLVVAAQGGSTINLLAGDGHGRFATPQSVFVPGAVTALGAGVIGNIGQPASVLIGVRGPQGPSLLLYHGSAAGLVLVTSYALPASATAFAFGDLDGHMIPDAAAVIAGGQLLMLHSAGSAAPTLKPVSVPFSVSAIALGSFAFDRNLRLQMALLSPDGAIHLMAPSGFDGSPWTGEQLKMLQQVRLRKLPSPFHPATNNQDELWSEVETFSGVAPVSGNGPSPLLVRTRSGGSGGDNLTIFNRTTGQTIVVSHPYAQRRVAEFARGQTIVQPTSAKAVVGAVPMRLNAAATAGVMAISAAQ